MGIVILAFDSDNHVVSMSATGTAASMIGDGTRVASLAIGSDAGAAG